MYQQETMNRILNNSSYDIKVKKKTVKKVALRIYFKWLAKKLKYLRSSSIEERLLKQLKKSINSFSGIDNKLFIFENGIC